MEDLRKNKGNKKERLEDALLEFIEKAVEEPASETDISHIPEAAKALIELWKIS